MKIFKTIKYFQENDIYIRRISKESNISYRQP